MVCSDTSKEWEREVQRGRMHHRGAGRDAYGKDWQRICSAGSIKIWTISHGKPAVIDMKRAFSTPWKLTFSESLLWEALFYPAIHQCLYCHHVHTANSQVSLFLLSNGLAILIFGWVFGNTQTWVFFFSFHIGFKELNKLNLSLDTHIRTLAQQICSHLPFWHRCCRLASLMDLNWWSHDVRFIYLWTKSAQVLFNYPAMGKQLLIFCQHIRTLEKEGLFVFYTHASDAVRW